MPNDAVGQDYFVGQTFGRYRIVERIGAGGMGIVYRAEDLHLDRREVAIKILPQGALADDAARERFRHEAHSLSRLHHPNIATIIDFDSARDLDFLVQELVQGVSLDDMLLHGQLGEKEIVSLGVQLCEGVAAAHETGIIHRDIKPSNLRVTSDAHLKILDFGLARNLRTIAKEGADTITFSETQIVQGTLPYMSPEQLRNQKLDAHTDIWAIGCVLYEMATGRRPFLGQGPALIDEILNHPPAAPSRLNPRVVPGLEAIILKCLEKDPSLRYATARDIAVDLRRLSNSTTFVPPPAPKTVRLVWKLLTAVVVVAIASIGLYYWTHRHPVLPERGWVLVTDFDTSGESGIPDKGIREALTIALQQSRYINVFSRSRAYEVLQRMKKPEATHIDEALGKEICQRENLQVLLTGSVERIGQISQISVRALDPQGRQLFVERERLRSEDNFFDKVDSLSRKIRKDLGESLEHIQKNSKPLAKVTTSSLDALQLYSRANDAKYQSKDEQIEELLKGALLLDPDFAMAHLRLGQFYLAVVGKNTRAADELQRAYQLRTGLTEREQRTIEAGYYALHEQYEKEVESLSIFVGLYPDDEEAHLELASAYYDLGQVEKAIQELNEVLRLDPASASAYRNLVLYLAFVDQPDQALAAYRQAQQRGAESSRIHWGVGLAHLAKNDVAQARLEFQAIGQATDTDRALRQLCLAVADLYEGKLASAEVILNASEQRTSISGGLEIFERYLLGRVYLLQSNPQAAAEQADLIMRLPRTELQVTDLMNSGVLYSRSGRFAKAQSVVRIIESQQKAFPSASSQRCLDTVNGEIALAQSKHADAASAFTAAMQVYPTVLSQIGLAKVYQSRHQWELAAAQWEQVLRSTGEILHLEFPPDLPLAHLELARIYFHMGRPDQARRHYQEAMDMLQHADESPLRRVIQNEFKQLSAKASSAPSDSQALVSNLSAPAGYK